MEGKSGSIFSRIRSSWRKLPPRWRSIITGIIKGIITVGAFYLLFTHKIAVKDQIEVIIDDTMTVQVTKGEVLSTDDGLRGTLEVGPQIRLDSGELVRLSASLKDKVALMASKVLPFVKTKEIAKGIDVQLPTGQRGRVRILHISTISAIRENLGEIVLSTFLLFAIMATFVKFMGVFGNMFRWHLLLVGQGMRFPFGHIVGNFLIGRFLGTFMPSTIGLDGYRLYDATHFSKRGIESAAALVIDKVLGFVGIFLTFLVALPFGYRLLGDKAGITVAITVPVALGIILAFFLALFYPGIVQYFIGLLPLPAKGKIREYINRVNHSAAAYKHKKGLLVTCAFFAFFGHFTTAAMYFFTALAVGVVGAAFWLVTFGSSIQIFATLISPTMAGEGAREIVQAWVLGGYIGHSEAILSAALGFWAAEAMTLSGVFFLWARRGGYKPKFLYLKKQEEGLDIDQTVSTLPREPELSRFQKLLTHFKAGLLSGLLAGAVLGLMEAIAIVITRPGLPERWVLFYAPILYGFVFAFIGACMGLGMGVLSALLGGRASLSRSYAFYWSAIFALFAFITTRFRIIRDVLMEKPFRLHYQVLLLLAFVIVFLLARFILGRLLERRTWRRLTTVGGSVGAYVILIAVAGLVAGGIWLATRPPRAPAPETIPAALQDKPNIILIMVDALRADRLSCYGYGPQISPNIDALAGDAIRFETCIAQASWTKPSTATLFTSLYPSSHQAIYKSNMLPDPVVSIAELLSAEGYFALGFANNANITPIFNFGQGFDEYIFLKPSYFFMSPESGFQLTAYNQLRLIRERFVSQAKHVYHYYQDAQVVNKNVISWLEKLQHGRFFTFIHYMETHDPYFVHPYNGVGYARVSNPKPNPSVAGLYSETYDGELRYVDQAVGDLCRWLKNRDLYDDALIILTADHGQEFYEHGGWWHGTTLYEEQIHVPLIVKLPRGQGAGTTDGRMVRILDIAPTITTLVGISPHPSMQGLSFLSSSSSPWPGAEEVFSEEDHEGNVIRSLRTRTWKFIQANPNNPRGLPEVALFHLEEDPVELNNLAAQRQDLVEILRPRLENTSSMALGESVTPQERDIDEATRERLKSLGYVE
jgi:arylsulfatase A-like enzyme